jgi:hypothetical protein
MHASDGTRLFRASGDDRPPELPMATIHGKNQDQPIEADPREGAYSVGCRLQQAVTKNSEEGRNGRVPVALDNKRRDSKKR